MSSQHLLNLVLEEEDYGQHDRREPAVWALFIVMDGARYKLAQTRALDETEAMLNIAESLFKETS